ncbi:MAG TPA: mechanosensitive ion channel [Phycisphaerae bacterium]|nr:mechanosensitive ion channel [Phycisphaerae bacterium]HRY68504.1 mechanosensitive ion channel [Phycisphaerae bacterium]HSA25552.1 mechanosensitive ion channel [Phycisphaerae bacterium]
MDERMKISRLLLGAVLGLGCPGTLLRAEVGSTGQTEGGFLIAGQSVASQSASSPGTTPASQPAEADSEESDSGPAAPALAPRILPAPATDADIVKRLELVQQEMDRFHIATQPASMPASSPAEEAARKADPKYALAQALRQYYTELKDWQKTRARIAWLKGAENLAKLSADLDLWEKQRQNYVALNAGDIGYVWDSRVGEIEKRYAEEAAKLQDLATLQASREQQLISLVKQKPENEEAIKETLDALRLCTADLPAQFTQLKTEAEREPLLMRKRALEWEHNLRLLRAAVFPDQGTAAEVARQQGGDRIAALTKYVSALRQYQTRLSDVRAKSNVAFASEQLARPDLSPHMKINWGVRLAIAQTVADFQKIEATVRELIPVAEVDRLEQRVQRGQAYLDLTMESLDRRSGESILDLYRRVNLYLARFQDSLKTMRSDQDRLYDQMRTAQDRRDQLMERVRRGREALEEQIKSLKPEEVVRVREAQANLTDDLNAVLKTKIDPLMAEMENLRDRLKKTIPMLDVCVTRIQRDRAKMYRTYLVVRGRSLLWPDSANLAEEWRSILSREGKTIEEAVTKQRDVVREWRAVTWAGWCGAAALMVLTGCLAWRCRRRLLAWSQHKEESLLARMAVPASEGHPPAASFLAVKRFEVQAARALARTAAAWPLAVLLLFLTEINLGRNALLPVASILTIALLAIIAFATVTALFDAHRPQTRLVQCDDRVAAYHRRWLRVILVTALVVLPVPIVLRVSSLFPLIASLWWDGSVLLLLTMLFIYLVRRDFFFPPRTASPDGSVSWLLPLYRGLFPLVPATVALVIAGMLAGYAALVDYVLLGLGLTALILLATRVIRRFLAGWLAEVASPEAEGARASTWQRIRTIHPLLPPIMQVIRLGVLLLALVAVLAVWGITPLDVNTLLNYPLLQTAKGAITLWRLVAAVCVVVVGLFISRTARAFLEREVFPQTRNVDRGTQAAIMLLLHYSIIALSCYVALNVAMIDLGGLTILFGTLGLGLGLGLQPLFVNFISGLMILFERQIKVGDLIEVNGQPGEVISISMRSTRIRSFDNIDFVIPNGDFITGQVINWTLSDPRMRAKIDVGVAYGTDVELARKLLLDLANRNPFVLAAPAPEVWFKNFGESSLDFVLVCWFANPKSRGEFMSQIRFEIDRVFREHRIEIPFPQRSISFGGGRPIPVEVVEPPPVQCEGREPTTSSHDPSGK